MIVTRSLNGLAGFRKMEKDKNLTEEEFTAAFSDVYFVVTNSEGHEVELVPGGRNIPLTWKNREQFSEALVNCRKTEFLMQTNAIRRGLATVVPFSLLSLFHWEQLELQVCGVPVVDVNLLEKMTKYQGCTPDEPHIQFFWTMMRERFDEREKAKVLKFVW